MPDDPTVRLDIVGVSALMRCLADHERRLAYSRGNGYAPTTIEALRRIALRPKADSGELVALAVQSGKSRKSLSMTLSRIRCSGYSPGYWPEVDELYSPLAGVGS